MAEDVRTRLLQNIHDLQADYHEAQSRIDNQQPLAEKLYDIWRELCMYDPNRDPHYAVYVVARCRTMLEEFADYYSAIAAYNEAQRKLEEYDRRRNLENG